MIEIRWHGRGGQGAFTAARLLGQAVSVYEGKHSQAFPSFGPERRGAPVLSFTRIDDNIIYDRSEVVTCDYVVILDDTLYDKDVTSGLVSGGVVLINTTKNPSEFEGSEFRIVTVDATSMALDILGIPITNVPMLGALASVSGVVQLESIYKSIDTQLAPAIREKNKKLLLEAYNSVKEEE